MTLVGKSGLDALDRRIDWKGDNADPMPCPPGTLLSFVEDRILWRGSCSCSAETPSQACPASTVSLPSLTFPWVLLCSTNDGW